MSEDAKLREHFGALRRRDEARAPDFSMMLTQARARASDRPRFRKAWSLTAAAAAGAILLWLVRVDAPPTTPAVVDDFAVGGWQMPTDILLETPGVELLRSPDWEPFANPTRGVEPQSQSHRRSHG